MNIDHILLLVITVFQLLTWIAGFFATLWIRGLFERIKTIEEENAVQDKKIDAIKEEVHNIHLEYLAKLADVKTNYTDRFDDVKTTMEEYHTEQVKLLSEQKAFCKAMQEGKKK